MGPIELNQEAENEVLDGSHLESEVDPFGDLEDWAGAVQLKVERQKKDRESKPKDPMESMKKRLAEEAHAAAEDAIANREKPEGGWLKWGALQEQMLIAEIQDEGWGGEAMRDLAKRLRSTMEDMHEVFMMTDPSQWNTARMEKLLELEQMKSRAYNWDALENATLRKLMTLVDKNYITKTSELLAVAGVANRATRRVTPPGSGDQPMSRGDGNGGGVQVNIFGQPIAQELPGAGNLGTIQLSLSQRTLSQLSKGKTIDGESERLTESAEMLKGSDIPELQELSKNHE